MCICGRLHQRPCAGELGGEVDLAAAVDQALAKRGFPQHTLEEYRTMVGHGVRNLMKQAMPEGMIPLQHSAADLGDLVVCGTRGWMIPTEGNPLEPEDEKIYLREAQRLTLALDEAVRIAAGRPIAVMMHFPPLLAGERESAFTGILESRGIFLCVYGHLHGAGIRSGFTGEQNGVRYVLASCDSIDFSPLRIL